MYTYTKAMKNSTADSVMLSVQQRWLITSIGDVMAYWWKCGGLLVEMCWLIGGNVVAFWWKYVGLLVEICWLIGGNVLAYWWR